jgi:hypothetical protein
MPLVGRSLDLWKRTIIISLCSCDRLSFTFSYLQLSHVTPHIFLFLKSSRNVVIIHPTHFISSSVLQCFILLVIGGSLIQGLSRSTLFHFFRFSASSFNPQYLLRFLKSSWNFVILLPTHFISSSVLQCFILLVIGGSLIQGLSRSTFFSPLN